LVRHRIRRKEGFNKFRLGLSFERAGLALGGDHFIDSDTALAICLKVVAELTERPAAEHEFYRLGEASFADKESIGNTPQLEKMKALLGEQWKRWRYHHLVRLGGDIIRSGLSEYPTATVLGALLYYAEQSADP